MGQFDLHVGLEITIIGIVCKQLFRRELCFYVKWKVGRVVVLKLFRMKKNCP